jgi:glutamate synthase (NADPH/NADH) small chain
VTPQLPATRSWKKVAVVGSGPAGLAAADQLNRAGHLVTVFEKSDRIGGLLRYGIPEFKMEKRILDRRLALMEAEGVVFRPGVNVGVDVPMKRLQSDFDAILLGRRRRTTARPEGSRTGSERNPFRDGVPDAAETAAARAIRFRMRSSSPPRSRRRHHRWRRYGADCLGTVHRQGARSVHQLELMPMPPETRAAGQSVAAMALDFPNLTRA